MPEILGSLLSLFQLPKSAEGQVPIGLPMSIQTNSSILAPPLKFVEDSFWLLKVLSGATRTHRIAKKIFILRLLFVSLYTFRNGHHFSLSATFFFAISVVTYLLSCTRYA